KLSAETVTPVVLSFARYYEGRGDFGEAERLFDSAAQTCPESDLGQGRAVLYADWAEDDLKGSKLADALKHYEQAWAMVKYADEPLKTEIPHRLSDCYRQQAAIAQIRSGGDQDAIALLEKCLT